MPLFQIAAQPATDSPRSGFAATFDLQLELRLEADSATPEGSCFQEQSLALLPRRSSLMTVPQAAVCICSALFYSVAHQKCHGDDDASISKHLRGVVVVGESYSGKLIAPNALNRSTGRLMRGFINTRDPSSDKI